ncbi:MAG TPA: SapC family protein [Caldimonas sp.]|nr:SapC family protein [Caldimonas sp.]
MSRPPPSLYRRPVALDPAVHGAQRIAPLTDFSIARELHAVFVTATEFAQAALEFPIVFVETGRHDAAGQPRLSPLALLGLSHGENLHVEGPAWQARYIPASIRRYPFSTAAMPGASGINVLVDEAWSGFSAQAGDPLFEPGGAPAPALKRAIDFLERFEHESERTQAFCQRIVSLGILKEMKADATLQDGQRLSVDGFHAVDEEKLRELPDSTLLELWRTGLLMLIHAHMLSLANIRHLVNRKAARLEATRRADPVS